LQRNGIPLNAGACICEKAACICDDEGSRDIYLQQARFWLWREAECTFRYSSLNSKWVEQQCVHSASHLWTPSGWSSSRVYNQVVIFEPKWMEPAPLTQSWKKLKGSDLLQCDSCAEWCIVSDCVCKLYLVLELPSVCISFLPPLAHSWESTCVGTDVQKASYKELRELYLC
jgi:hypothetical protein